MGNRRKCGGANFRLQEMTGFSRTFHEDCDILSANSQIENLQCVIMVHKLLAILLIAMGTVLYCPHSDLLAAGNPKKPNIVLILADDLGYGDLGCYGNKLIRTPNIDRIATDGIRFTSFYTDAPVCSPTRASILTGRYPQRHGLTNVIETSDHKTHLSEREILLPQLLQEAGYVTGLIGKWHVGEQKAFRPNDRGFDHFFGNLLGGLDFYRHDFVNGQHDLFLNDKPVHRKGEYVTDLLAENAESFIRDNAGKPFFLFLSFQAVHTSMGSKNRGKIQSPPRWLKKYAPNREPSKSDQYRACVSAMDEAVGRVQRALEKHQLRDNTIVIFLSDNGPEPRWTGTATPFFGTKHSLWEGGVRVPFLVSWPGELPANKKIDAPAITHDLLPTVLAMAKIKSPKKSQPDGENLLPLMRGKHRQQTRTLYWSYIRDTLRKSRERAVRKGKWKWLNGELYDLHNDPGETTNLADKHPEIVRMLASDWQRWVQQFPREVQRWGNRQPMRHKMDKRK